MKNTNVLLFLLETHTQTHARTHARTMFGEKIAHTLDFMFTLFRTIVHTLKDADPDLTVYG